MVVCIYYYVTDYGKLLTSNSPAAACYFSATANKVSSDDEMLNIKRQGYRTMSTEAISKLQINKYIQFLFLFFFRSSPKRGRYWKGRASVLSSIITME